MQINGQKQNFDITYAAKPDAPTIGPVVSTKVKFGNVSVPDFGVGIATKEGFNYPLDGFMGLGFQGLNTGEWIPPRFVGLTKAVTNDRGCSPANTTTDLHGGCATETSAAHFHNRSQAKLSRHAQFRICRQVAIPSGLDHGIRRQ